MLTIRIPEYQEADIWNDKIKKFVKIEAFKGCTLMLEHSLISISKWEMKWHVPFISKENRTEEQTLHYIKCMTLNTVPSNTYDHLTVKDINDISDYINDPMTASLVKDIPSKKGKSETVTNELIYYWMISLQIPFECEKWHLNHLLQLITVCNVKNAPPKKMGKRETMDMYRKLNEERKAKYHTTG